MTNEEILAKLENATDDETEVLLKVFAENEKVEGEELTQDELEDVAGGASIRSVSELYRWYNRLSQDKKKKFKNKLKQMIRELSRFGNVKIPF